VAAVSAWPVPWDPCDRRKGTAGPLGPLWPPWGVVGTLGTVYPPWGHGLFPGPVLPRC